MENELYDDIVQMDFVDTYQNLTLKTMSILKWLSTHSNTAIFAIKSDTDVLIEPELLISAMNRKFKLERSFLIGNVNGGRHGPIRDPSSKWHVPRSMYKTSTYPSFCHGPTYGFTVNVADKLFEASLHLPFFYLEDVFITGMCAREAGVKHLTDPEFTYRH